MVETEQSKNRRDKKEPKVRESFLFTGLGNTGLFLLLPVEGRQTGYFKSER